jgi:CHAT domain-containing protein
LYVFVLDQDGLRLLRKNIDIEALQKTVNAYKDSINKTFRSIQADNSDGINAHYANTAVLGQRLYEELLGWPEIESRLQHTNLLYVIPDEFLYELPFSTLRANRSDVQTFLVNRAAVLTLPSASLLRSENHAGAAPSHLKTMKVLVSADKRFPGADKFVAKAKALFPLAEELMVQDSAFTKDKVLAQLQKDYQAYIFVGHGQANSQYPDQGYIELSVKTPKAPATKIVRLAMADLKTINWLAAEMVMLVGCETVGRKLYRGTGISGLQQEFLSLGVKNVLGNLWEVDATHAILQAQDFLTTWAMTGDPLRALRESQLKAVQRLQGHRYYQQPHPYFWGSSVLATVQYQ